MCLGSDSRTQRPAVLSSTTRYITLPAGWWVGVYPLRPESGQVQCQLGRVEYDFGEQAHVVVI